MKNFTKLAVIIAMLCPSVNSMAEESTSNAPKYLKIGGGIVAVLGGVAWWQQNDELDECLSPPAGTVCFNRSELEDAVNLRLGITAVGVGAVILGFVLDKDNINGFRFRAINTVLSLSGMDCHFPPLARADETTKKLELLIVFL